MSENKIDNTQIGGKYTGNDDNSTNNHYDLSNVENAKHILHDIKIIEAFSLSAKTHLAKVSAKIAEAYHIDSQREDLGFDKIELKEKLSNMKCSATYKKDFDEMSSFFHTVDELLKNDAVEGGSRTIKAIISFIKKLYLQYLDKFENGDQIHNAILTDLMKQDDNDFYISANILIFYVVRGCGIFNEKK